MSENWYGDGGGPWSTRFDGSDACRSCLLHSSYLAFHSSTMLYEPKNWKVVVSSHAHGLPSGYYNGRSKSHSSSHSSLIFLIFLRTLHCLLASWGNSSSQKTISAGLCDGWNVVAVAVADKVAYCFNCEYSKSLHEVLKLINCGLDGGSMFT
jgi:hypothetical protein